MSLVTLPPRTISNDHHSAETDFNNDGLEEVVDARQAEPARTSVLIPVIIAITLSPLSLGRISRSSRRTIAPVI